MAVEWPIPLELVILVAALVGGALLVAKVVPPLVAARRQAAYERVATAEVVRLEIAPA